MERKYQIGAHVLYIDPKGQSHDALVTAWWPGEYSSGYCSGQDENGNLVQKEPGKGDEPTGVNVVYVCSEEDKSDPYGRQIERKASVVHRSLQPAHGNFWCWEDEVMDEDVFPMRATEADQLFPKG